MTALKDIIFETDQYWVKRVPKGFEVYKIGLTHSTRVAVIGYTGDKGLQRAKLEIERREAASGPSEQRHATKKSSTQLQCEIDEVLAKPKAGTVPKASEYKKLATATSERPSRRYTVASTSSRPVLTGTLGDQ